MKDFFKSCFYIGFFIFCVVNFGFLISIVGLIVCLGCKEDKETEKRVKRLEDAAKAKEDYFWSPK